MLRASYGRFSQGVLTGELQPLPSRRDPDHDDRRLRSGDRRLHAPSSRVVDPKTNLLLDRETRAPHTDEYSVGIDREIGRRLAVAVAYVRKDGADFIGWTDVGGQYRDETQDAGRRHASCRCPCSSTSPAARRFLLTNPGRLFADLQRPGDGGGKTAIATGGRRSARIRSREPYGLQASSGTTAAGAQVSTVAPPANHDVRARSQRSHQRVRPAAERSTAHVSRRRQRRRAADRHRPRREPAGFSGKPWAATTQITLPQGDQRILLEPRGSRRLSSQTLLDLRLSRAIAFGGAGRIELLLDVLNALNDTAEEGLATDNLFSPNFGQATVFVDPRRVMFGVRVNFGR